MKSVLYFVSALALITAFSSCSDDLTRNYAAKKIIEHYGYPNDMDFTIGQSIDFMDYNGSLKRYQDAGLLSINQGWDVTVTLSDNGAKYARPPLDGESKMYYHVRLCRRNFKEITGISYGQDKTLAKVDFTTTVSDITPFGTVQGLMKDQVLNYSVSMRKYDDGWRIE